LHHPLTADNLPHEIAKYPGTVRVDPVLMREKPRCYLDSPGVRPMLLLFAAIAHRAANGPAGAPANGTAGRITPGFLFSEAAKTHEILMAPLVVSHHFCAGEAGLSAEHPVRVRIGAPDR
jgi:hypothetical protein